MVNLRFWAPKGPATPHASDDAASSLNSTQFLDAGEFSYAIDKAENDSPPSYQDASGAPVETKSPLGYSVGPITIIFLNISKMVGTGVYSTPARILNGVGSVGLALFYWVFGLIIAVASLSVYLEFASYFPNRSGSEVVYLEQAYPRPRYLFPVTFAIQTVLLSFSSSNAIVLARYLFRAAASTPSDWELKGVAIAGYSTAVLLLIFHNRFSYFLNDAIGAIKLITILFVCITGWVVLAGGTSIENPHENFRNAFDGEGASAYGVTNALVSVIFSYQGYENAFNVVNEVRNPVRQIKIYGFGSLALIGVLYMFANIAYFAAVSKEDLRASNQIAASLFFENVFGGGGAARGLNLLIALSAFGNLIAVLLGQSRLIRECGRQGTLPFPRFWVTTWPFGTPIGPFVLKWAMTVLMILAPPAGDAFNFVVDLANYPQSFFYFLMAVGLLLVRWRRRKINAPRSQFRAWDIFIVITILVNFYLLVMPWYPPPGGATGGNVSFWYATYVVTGIGIILACAAYYVFWVIALPRWRGYRIRHERVVLEGGEVTHVLVKVPEADLVRWDRDHDAAGKKLGDWGSEGEGEQTSEGGSEGEEKVSPISVEAGVKN